LKLSNNLRTEYIKNKNYISFQYIKIIFHIIQLELLVWFFLYKYILQIILYKNGEIARRKIRTTENYERI